MKKTQTGNTANTNKDDYGIEDLNLDLHFIDSVADICGQTDKGTLDKHTIASLMSEIRAKVEKISAFTEALNKQAKGGPR